MEKNPDNQPEKIESDNMITDTELDDDFDMLSDDYNYITDLNFDEGNKNDNNEIKPLTDEQKSERIYEYIYLICNGEPVKNTNYSNESFCVCCKSQLILPHNEVNNFLNSHFDVKKKINIKYLLLVFRLCPYYFSMDYLMKNPILKNKMIEHLKSIGKISNDELTSINSNEQGEIILYDKYFSFINQVTPFAYEIYFHQPNLTFMDYIKCSICRGYMCPMHYYLSNSSCIKCTYCDKNWLVCGWCKPNFNEFYACKFIHQKS
jgi:hypothetical protein